MNVKTFNQIEDSSLVVSGLEGGDMLLEVHRDVYTDEADEYLRLKLIDVMYMDMPLATELGSLASGDISILPETYAHIIQEYCEPGASVIRIIDRNGNEFYVVCREVML